jgi:UDP-3-O-[3-hydroxymyristoyl] glucosamine N-acyltransferase
MADKRFFRINKTYTTGELAKLLACEIVGNAELKIEDIATLENADNTHITFLANRKYIAQFKTSKAGACICSREFIEQAPKDIVMLIANDPYSTYAQLTQILYGSNADTGKISKNAFIAETADIGKNVSIAAGAFIGDGVVIGNNTVIMQNTSITHAIIGDDCLIYPGVCIGQDGFGFAPNHQGIKKVLQLGRVVIGNQVEIGANTCIDRGAIDDTIIGYGTKLDNLVQIGHNVKIGKNCMMAAQVAIAGSAEIGNNCMIGGQAAVAGHLKVGNNCMIAGQSGIISNLQTGSVVGGTPALPIKQWHRLSILLKRMLNKGK